MGPLGAQEGEHRDAGEHHCQGVPFWSPDIQLPLSSHREYTPLPTTETWNVAFFSFIQLKALNG